MSDTISADLCQFLDDYSELFKELNVYAAAVKASGSNKVSVEFLDANQKFASAIFRCYSSDNHKSVIAEAKKEFHKIGIETTRFYCLHLLELIEKIEEQFTIPHFQSVFEGYYKEIRPKISEIKIHFETKDISPSKDNLSTLFIQSSFLSKCYQELLNREHSLKKAKREGNKSSSKGWASFLKQRIVILIFVLLGAGIIAYFKSCFPSISESNNRQVEKEQPLPPLSDSTLVD